MGQDVKVALVHDWLTGMRGGERCLEAFLRMYPDADIFTLLHLPGTTSDHIDSRVVRTSFLQRIPWIGRIYRLLLPFYPLAIRQFNFKGYDLIISLSHAAAKNITVPEGSVHVCYCFTPMRYIWDQAKNYFGKATAFLWPIFALLRRWDIRGSRQVTHFIAISEFVAARIRRYYGRSSDVIYPPVETGWIDPVRADTKGVAFLYAGALVPYKRPDQVVRLFNRLEEELWVVGSGPESERLKALAGPNIHFFGRVSDVELADFYKRCRALIFPGKEDFGMIPIECLAAGRPVIGVFAGAFKRSLNCVKHWALSSGESIDLTDKTGVFIAPGEQGEAVDRLEQAISYFIKNEAMFTSGVCTQWARRYSTRVFEESWEDFLKQHQLERFAGIQTGDGVDDAKAEAAAI